MNSTLILPRLDEPTKFAGGHCLIPVRELAALWWTYKRGNIRFIDLRVALAAREQVARRCVTAPGRATRFTVDELARLTGATPRRVRDSLRRLAAAGLLVWSESGVTFADGLAGKDHAEFEAWIDAITNHHRRVPVPRRMLRLLAGGARPVFLAAVFACLFRCCYLRSGRLETRGRIKASWIADVFEVDLRRVKDARKQLVDSGWLIPEPHDTQFAMNRWGRAYSVNPQWDRLDRLDAPEPTRDTAQPGPELPPPHADSGPEMPPPESSHREPLPRVEHQKPAPGGPAGVSTPDGTGEPTPSPPPDLRDVRPEDLRDTGRLLELHRQAVERGEITGSEADRQRFVGAAEHARAIGTRNACGLFVTIVRKKLWSFLTDDDEDAASRRLKSHLFPAPLSLAGAAKRTAAGPLLSCDARLVEAVRAELQGRGDAYLALRRHSPEWTRARYDRALAELEGARALGQCVGVGSLGWAVGGVAG